MMALHMFYIMECVWSFLSNKFGVKWFTVIEYVKKTEYQGRGTPHKHIAAWGVSHGPLRLLAGRTGTAIVSSFVKFLNLV